MKKFLFIFSFLIVSATVLWSQQADSSHHLRISILTCSPGDELYSTFGHTALRITDSVHGTDIVYNYGTFDFSDPDFYTKFTRGKLDYFLSVSDLPSFLYEYQVEKRDVTEQVLRLPDSVKIKIQSYLSQTLSGPARFYKYDFLYNNCTSRIRDILLQQTGFKVTTQLVPEGTSFRDMLHEYLNKGNQSWSKLGIDIVLGSPIDKKVNTDQSMFLPDYLMKGIDSAATTSFLEEKKILNKGENRQEAFQNQPLILFSVYTVLILVLSFSKKNRLVRFMRVHDFIWLLLTGLLGCFLLFMWFGTDHRSCAGNTNLLWALPTNLVAAFAFLKRKKWLTTYLRIAWPLTAILVVFSGNILPQDINFSLTPILALLIIRYLSIIKKQTVHA